ncbi:uncharacterized protein LOC124531355 isoform X2 [Vanessa cardui]|uniref:uncharacterized protein LOC124531355 isoform X2 n=1 Tax=Vanessa cardui TaxID=171605 RepID=UPI001F12B306|nr:uncharacterized protein LOC124531355 isoform X2 [Vanessa cardui]XP_046961850.1 uncharacterized protein LOC124531355 isoform X2 [Vanessa cardui]XP_046961851.1 uncharacterized protein LOC124531355 isoform X2 [Vanessa cardui]XP_046961852.1 uncharacterized protein LOC124531355 isoform X2 [Vanessa cardui]
MVLHTMSTAEDTISIDDLSLLVELVRFLSNIDTNLKKGSSADNSETNPEVTHEAVLKPVEESHRAEQSSFEPCSSSTANNIPHDEDDPNSTLNRELISIFGEPLQSNVQTTETPSWRSYANNPTADKSRKTEIANAYCEVHFWSDVRPTHKKKKNRKRKGLKN